MSKETFSKTKIYALDESERINFIIAHVIRIYDAFPDEDVEGHRDYHLAKIKAAQAEERFWIELKIDLAKKGAWGILIILLGFIMLGLATKLGIKP